MHIFKRKSGCAVGKTEIFPAAVSAAGDEGSGMDNDHGQCAEIGEIQSDTVAFENLSVYFGIFRRFGIASGCTEALVPEAVPCGGSACRKDHGCGACGRIFPSFDSFQGLFIDCVDRSKLCTVVRFGGKSHGTSVCIQHQAASLSEKGRGDSGGCRDCVESVLAVYGNLPVW